MELVEIRSLLSSTNPQSRMKAITELRHYQAAIAVPLLKSLVHDPEFMVRSFVAMGLGHKRTDEGYSLLLTILDQETDQNVVAEAANSLAKYGQQSISHLISLFERQSHWLVRQSILAAVADMDSSAQLLYLCQLAYSDEDPVVAQAGLAFLSQLSHTTHATVALDLLLQAAADPAPEIRAQAARILWQFNDPQATAALATLRQDTDHRVVGATLEGLVQSPSDSPSDPDMA